MNEQRLRELLRGTSIPGAAEAERRGLAVVEAVFAERGRGDEQRRQSLPRLALALVIAAVVGALLLSPAGAAVRHWIGDVFEPGVRNAEPALARIPGGGRLVVDSPAGPWVVQADGSRRLLGHYREATWSPHGLYLAAVSARTLTAVEPGGDPRWSIAAPGAVAEPRWSPSGFRIAYRSGVGLRVVHADGTADTLLDPRVAPVAPAWAPGGLHHLAYVDGHGRVVVRNADSGRLLGRGDGLPGVETLEWGPGGVLLEASPALVQVRQMTLEKLAGVLHLSPPSPLPLPDYGQLSDVALSPDGQTVAVLRQIEARARSRAEVDLVDLRAGTVRRFFGAPGRLGEIAWSPDSTRLLITWPEADQWLFVPVAGRGRVQAVADITRQFDPGARTTGAFPTLDGWCCPFNQP